MSKGEGRKVKKATKPKLSKETVKDLDAKATARNVKGGGPCPRSKQ